MSSDYYTQLGARFRMVRMGFLKISQEKLAEKLGCTYQQLQKYETGANRLPVHRMDRTLRAAGISKDNFLAFDTPLKVTLKKEPF